MKINYKVRSPDVSDFIAGRVNAKYDSVEEFERVLLVLQKKYNQMFFYGNDNKANVKEYMSRPDRADWVIGKHNNQILSTGPTSNWPKEVKDRPCIDSKLIT